MIEDYGYCVYEKNIAVGEEIIFSPFKVNIFVTDRIVFQSSNKNQNEKNTTHLNRHFSHK